MSDAPDEPIAQREPPVLDVRDLRTHFPVRAGVLQRVSEHVKAVDGVSFRLHRGETLGLVGESGCGKTTVGRSILRLIEPTSGDVRFEGRSILNLSARAMRQVRRHMQIIFQDPAGSLNPRMRIGPLVGEPLLVHGLAKGDALRTRVIELLERCGLDASATDRYPHEFSGGQRQRICIARALTLNPKLIICDEPTSALDVSIQSQILNLLEDLQDEFKLAYLFISHDIAVIHHMCERIAVMNGGKIVEAGDRDQIINDPQHAYTKKLLAAVPVAAPR